VAVALGITGCIGAYKAADLVRRLQRAGLDVQVVATRHALEFVTPLTLETVSRHPVICEMFQRPGDWEVEHIALARRVDVLCVAPATANIMAKFAAGVADDFLSTLYLSIQKPVVVAPAMNHAMWSHPATQANVAVLRARGVILLEPEAGYLACGEEGAGRLADLAVIEEAVHGAMTPKSLAGRTVLVTAGPTAEDIDPVRFITNRSTGKMGFAVARQAARRGARVILVSGPGAEPAPFPCTLVRVRSAAGMADAVAAHAPEADAVVMAAAVADYTPAAPSARKLKKGDGPIRLELRRTADILAGLGAARRPGRILVGFAAETDDLIANARRKLAAKGADLVVANAVGPDRGFGTDDHTVVILDPAGGAEELADQPKDAIAARLCERIAALLPAR
jgi:phosphopantothenoylcysteine decarboxylase/phosphopantothenate--cysteine ligase